MKAKSDKVYSAGRCPALFFISKKFLLKTGILLAAVIGIWKVSAAYMPIDPAFPTERLTFMCEDAGIRLILSENNLVEEKLPDFTDGRFYSDALTDLPSVTVDKAVALEHYGVVNYCYWYVDEYGLTMEDHVVGYANFGFDAHMIDFYPSMLAGSTECSLFSTYYDVPGYFEGKLIGRPLANYQLFIIDKTRRGYLNRPELTADKFINFKSLPDSEPMRAYRSGDLVRWSEDENIEYLGCIDNQVKLRGLRIELGEIENRVVSYLGIVQTVVDVKGKTNQQLCCYYVADRAIDADALKKHLAESRTEYTVPEVYMRLDALPLNSNGKVDRRALSEPKVEVGEIVAPETEDEKKIFTVTAQILGKDNFSVTTNLISQGIRKLSRLMITLFSSKNFSRATPSPPSKNILMNCLTA